MLNAELSTQVIQPYDIGAHRHEGQPFIRHFNGRMEDLSLWDRHFTEEEVMSRQCGIMDPANETGLKAYYKFNEKVGTVLVDELNSFNGIANSMTWAREEVDCSENVLSSSFSIEAFESLIPVVYPNLVMIDLLVKYNATWYNVNLHDYTVSIDLSKVCDNDVSIDVIGIS